MPALSPFSRCLLLPGVVWLLLAGWVARAVAQPADLEAWFEFRTPNFSLYSDAEPERAAAILLSLERFRAVFAGLAPGIELVSPAPTRIFVFRDESSYAPYKTTGGRDGGRVLGQFLAHRDGNFITLNGGARGVGSYAVVYHEYVHYFVRHNFPSVPLWFNEGLAEYYSTFAVEEESAYLGRPVERHVRWLKRGGEIVLDDLLAKSKGRSKYHEDGRVGDFYAVSWGLVHYLMSAEKGLERLGDFLIKVEDGEEPEAAFEQAFDLRLRRLETVLAEHMLANTAIVAKIPLARLPAPDAVDLYRPPPATLLVELGELLAQSGRREAAEDHFQLALQFQPDNSRAHGGLAYLRDLVGRFDEAAVLYHDVLRLGCQSALIHLRHGRHLLLQMNQARSSAEKIALAAAARQALSRAVDLAPDFAEARATRGYAHLFGDADPAAGISDLERAVAVLPERMDVAYQLVQLYVAAGRFHSAAQVTEGVLARGADPELVIEARQLIERTRLTRAAEKALQEGHGEEALELYDRAIEATSDPLLRERMEEQLLNLQESLRQVS